MAGENGQSARDLDDALRRAPWDFGFFQALRLVEATHTQHPRLGTAPKPSQEPVRLGQEPGLSFEASTLTAYTPGRDGAAPKLSGRAFGLFGTNGPLPLHFTEYARDRLRNHNDSTFAAFVDIFHHRMIELFYRAWANNEPTVHFDRADADRFSFYMAALVGIATEGLQHRDAVTDLTKFHFAGFLSCQAKHPDGLQAMLADYFRIGVTVQEYVGAWMPIEPSDRTRLGESPRTGALGVSAVIGSRIWDCQHKFRLRLGPLGYARYVALLPSGDSLARLVSLVRSYIGDELMWDVNLVLKKEEVPPALLDGSVRLGWTTWLGHRRDESDAADLMLNPFWGGARCRPAPAGA